VSSWLPSTVAPSIGVAVPPTFAALETNNLLPYCKIKSETDVINVYVPTGPLVKLPLKTATLFDTDGTIVLASISVTNHYLQTSALILVPFSYELLYITI
jgi:hypothetical protein